MTRVGFGGSGTYRCGHPDEADLRSESGKLLRLRGRCTHGVDAVDFREVAHHSGAELAAYVAVAAGGKDVWRRMGHGMAVVSEEVGRLWTCPT